MSNNVNHPSHYNAGRFEVIEIIEDQVPDFHLGNAVKYICRAGKKDPNRFVEDLKKAIWYINRKIELQTAKESGMDPRRPNDMNPRKSCEDSNHAWGAAYEFAGSKWFDCKHCSARCKE